MKRRPRHRSALTDELAVIRSCYDYVTVDEGTTDKLPVVTFDLKAGDDETRHVMLVIEVTSGYPYQLPNISLSLPTGTSVTVPAAQAIGTKVREAVSLQPQLGLPCMQLAVSTAMEELAAPTIAPTGASPPREHAAMPQAKDAPKGTAAAATPTNNLVPNLSVRVDPAGDLTIDIKQKKLQVLCMHLLQRLCAADVKGLSHTPSQEAFAALAQYLSLDLHVFPDSLARDYQYRWVKKYFRQAVETAAEQGRDVALVVGGGRRCEHFCEGISAPRTFPLQNGFHSAEEARRRGICGCVSLPQAGGWSAVRPQAHHFEVQEFGTYLAGSADACILVAPKYRAVL